MHRIIQQYIQQMSAEYLWSYGQHPSVLLEDSMIKFFPASQSVAKWPWWAKWGGHSLTKWLLTRPGLTETAGERGPQLWQQRGKMVSFVASRELVRGSCIDSQGRRDSHLLTEAPSGSHRIPGDQKCFRLGRLHTGKSVCSLYARSQRTDICEKRRKDQECSHELV